MRRALLLRSSRVSPLFERRPVNGPSTLVAPLAAMRVAGEAETTRYFPPPSTVPSAKVNCTPPASDQPERSMSTAIKLCNSTHSNCASLVAFG